MTPVTKTIAIVQARMTSSRLPGKVLRPLAGRPLIDRVVERLQRCSLLDDICIAIPDGDAQQPLVEHLSQAKGVLISRGSEHDVLERTLAAAESCAASNVVRVTSDCPFIDPSIVDTLVAGRQAGEFDYARTAMETGFPLGFDCEAFTIGALRVAAEEADDPYEREHVTPFLWRRPERFSTLILDHKPDRRHWRLVVDTERDLSMANVVYEAMIQLKPNFSYHDLQIYFSMNPQILTMNQGVEQTPYTYLDIK